MLRAPAPLSEVLARAWARRQVLSSHTTFYRAVHTTETGGLFALDRAEQVGVLSLYRDLSAAKEQQLAAQCAQYGLETIYLKRRPPEARHLANVQREWLAPLKPLLGKAQPEVSISEQGTPYLLRPASDLSIGLFSDARPARQWVRANAKPGGRVLNTFAYTCGFGVAARRGGAGEVKNLDLSRKVLAWGQENYALSGLTAPDHDFLYGDVFEWLGRLHKRAEQFDLVILDPPSFARSKAGVWRSERDYATLLSQAAAVTAPGGRVLALCNHAGVRPAQFEAMLQAGARQAGKSLHITERFGAGADYPQAAHLKVWALELR